MRRRFLTSLAVFRLVIKMNIQLNPWLKQPLFRRITWQISSHLALFFSQAATSWKNRHSSFIHNFGIFIKSTSILYSIIYMRRIPSSQTWEATWVCSWAKASTEFMKYCRSCFTKLLPIWNHIWAKWLWSLINGNKFTTSTCYAYGYTQYERNGTPWYFLYQSPANFDINVPFLSQISFVEFIRLLHEIRSSHYLQTYICSPKKALLGFTVIALSWTTKMKVKEKTIVDGGSRQGLSHLAQNLISSVPFG